MVPREPPPPSASSQLRFPPPRDASAHSKYSLPSSSNEADDERTESDHSFDSLEETPTMRAPLKYSNEDTRPTSRKELAGFYMYGFAAEVREIPFQEAVDGLPRSAAKADPP
jgi:MFS transporter, UMF1 family